MMPCFVIVVMEYISSSTCRSWQCNDIPGKGWGAFATRAAIFLAPNGCVNDHYIISVAARLTSREREQFVQLRSDVDLKQNFKYFFETVMQNSFSWKSLPFCLALTTIACRVTEMTTRKWQDDGFVTAKDIAKGKEITFNHNAPFTALNVFLGRQAIVKMSCRCKFGDQSSASRDPSDEFHGLMEQRR
ncbi:hypothetical protein BJ878DRAFT_554969 [Calycina marina]|uniref:Uncharacterized protein n=1 Tax=Calycina marina TaxID=1763456 RepID=A0A9P7Z966_9HELO|nr:hypothetical protein BJ878DRAFT_554969 [Calycina marina]